MNVKKRMERFESAHGHKPMALITGGSSGMGLEYARQLGAAGCPLVIVSNQADILPSVASELAGKYAVKVFWRFQNLAEPEAADELFEWCRGEGYEIDILVSNAGMFFFEELTPDNIGKAQAMMNLHMTTPSRLMILFGNEMKKRGRGWIISMSSMAARMPAPGITIYAATKAYLRSFGQSLWFEMHPYGVGVTTVCPAAIATPLYRLKPSLLNLGVKLGVISTPQWLVRKAIAATLRGRRLYSPSLQNIYFPPMLRLLPCFLENKLWARFK